MYAATDIANDSVDIVVGGRRPIDGDERAVAQDPDRGRDHGVAMDLELEARAEALDRDDRARVRAFAAQHAVITCAPAQKSLDAPDHDFLQRGDERRMLHQHDANHPRKRQRPLPIARRREHIVDEMRGDGDSSPSVRWFAP